MSVQAFRVEGTFRMSRGHAGTTPFKVETTAADEGAARERVVSTLGSRHRVTRLGVKIARVTALTLDQVTDPAVRHALEKGV
ncbi:MAG TPA: 50S ribosomal protein L18Ae [Candidatus Thermoplasmatota archaeon]|nr:50S ribosomal protein L18Ae [Candidatus Thermoplasmatota archaeon]